MVRENAARDLVRDRETKYAAYANAGVPLYLLVDRYEGGGFTTVHSKPFDREYLEKVKVPFGGKLSLPAPFDVEIDTAEF